MKKYETSSEEVIEKRYRHFMFILYPEWENYEEILQDIKGNFKNWAYITHKPESEEKKEHTHVILSLDNPRTIESICKRLEIPTLLCQKIRGLRGACRYLVHKDNEDKIQYDLKDVFVSNSFKDTFFSSFDDLLSETDMLENIYDFIRDHKDCSSIEVEVMLTQFVCSVNYNRVFKRYYNTLVKYIHSVCDK
ncbi:MAG: hypothetical protein J6D28_05235 [Bacilli bacterium]|nr:hypothetical protein [Bacilli bacterium]MBP3920953.1 hypothetical protein [Bacilli bacterium]